MADTPHGEPIRITGEQRLHPALRKLGRACIALARWQREQQHTPTEPTDETTSDTYTGDQLTTATEAPVVPAQEPRS